MRPTMIPRSITALMPTSATKSGLRLLSQSNALVLVGCTAFTTVLSLETASAAREAPGAINETGDDEGLVTTELVASETAVADDADDETIVSPVKLAGNALAATRG